LRLLLLVGSILLEFSNLGLQLASVLDQLDGVDRDQGNGGYGEDDGVLLHDMTFQSRGLIIGHVFYASQKTKT